MTRTRSRASSGRLAALKQARRYFVSSPRWAARIACRSGVRPRGYLVSAVSDNPVAARELESRWGYTVAVGEAGLDRSYHELRVSGGGTCENRDRPQGSRSGAPADEENSTTVRCEDRVMIVPFVSAQLRFHAGVEIEHPELWTPGARGVGRESVRWLSKAWRNRRALVDVEGEISAVRGEGETARMALA